MGSVAGDAAEQIVRIGLEGAEAAVRLAGRGARHLAVMLCAVLRDQGKTRGRATLERMLRSGRELRVFSVRDGDLRTFCREAKRYGVLFTVLKDRDAKDGLTDLMVPAEDAGKVNRIFERYRLSAVGEPETERNGIRDADLSPEEKVERFLEDIENGAPEAGRSQEDPAPARTGTSPRSGPSSKTRRNGERDASDGPGQRPSVRRELEEIRREQRKAERQGRQAPGRALMEGERKDGSR